jgi:L-methionine (R)-S-oxide reductase
MFASAFDREAPKPELYEALARSLESLLEGSGEALADLANAAALLWEALPEINWAGFYVRRGDDLVLGPFQGRPACVRIPIGRGVCGTAALSGETLVVPDVARFPGHIACDAASRSEIVVPLIRSGATVGVLDVDAPAAGRFDREDRAGLERFAGILVPRVDWERL